MIRPSIRHRDHREKEERTETMSESCRAGPRVRAVRVGTFLRNVRSESANFQCSERRFYRVERKEHKGSIFAIHVFLAVNAPVAAASREGILPRHPSSAALLVTARQVSPALSRLGWLPQPRPQLWSAHGLRTQVTVHVPHFAFHTPQSPLRNAPLLPTFSSRSPPSRSYHLPPVTRRRIDPFNC
jgi:hypothetical protein